MNRCLGKLFVEIIKVYIDDIIKSRKPDQLVDDLRAASARLLEFRIKLNIDKCVFGVPM
jgi:hypothetical protein